MVLLKIFLFIEVVGGVVLAVALGVVLLRRDRRRAVAASGGLESTIRPSFRRHATSVVVTLLVALVCGVLIVLAPMSPDLTAALPLVAGIAGCAVVAVWAPPVGRPVRGGHVSIAAVQRRDPWSYLSRGFTTFTLAVLAVGLISLLGIGLASTLSDAGMITSNSLSILGERVAYGTTYFPGWGVVLPIGLVQVALSALGLVALSRITRPAPPNDAAMMAVDTNIRRTTSVLIGRLVLAALLASTGWILWSIGGNMQGGFGYMTADGVEISSPSSTAPFGALLQLLSAAMIYSSVGLTFAVATSPFTAWTKARRDTSRPASPEVLA